MAKRSQKSARDRVFERRLVTLVRLLDEALEDTECWYRHEHDDAMWIRERHKVKVHFLGMELLTEIFGPSHDIVAEFKRKTTDYDVTSFEAAKALVLAVAIMVKDGWLNRQRAEAAQRIFVDYLDMAGQLLLDDMPSAAAVIAMGAVEVHMRRLCVNAGIATDGTDKNGYKRPKAAEGLNEELCKAKVYDMAEQKLITAFLEVRKHAAHGQHQNVRRESVETLVPWARTFIVRHPA